MLYDVLVVATIVLALAGIIYAAIDTSRKPAYYVGLVRLKYNAPDRREAMALDRENFQEIDALHDEKNISLEASAGIPDSTNRYLLNTTSSELDLVKIETGLAEVHGWLKGLGNSVIGDHADFDVDGLSVANTKQGIRYYFVEAKYKTLSEKDALAARQEDRLNEFERRLRELEEREASRDWQTASAAAAEPRLSKTVH
jgi:hypothetical protein